MQNWHEREKLETGLVNIHMKHIQHIRYQPIILTNQSAVSEFLFVLCII